MVGVGRALYEGNVEAMVEDFAMLLVSTCTGGGPHPSSLSTAVNCKCCQRSRIEDSSQHVRIRCYIQSTMKQYKQGKGPFLGSFLPIFQPLACISNSCWWGPELCVLFSVDTYARYPFACVESGEI
ncbi:hypothetical protein SUGI_0392550 [Cryptomeria japonica]|nr:hypothetical protein SUGI_0392550 [Cryptomeria japonica]